MNSRLVACIACLMAASVAGSAEGYRYDVSLPGDQPSIHIESKSGSVKAKTYNIPSSSKLVLKAMRIQYDSAAQQTFLEGAASVSYDDQVVSGDQIVLLRLERDGNAEILMISVSGEATIRLVPKAG